MPGASLYTRMPESSGAHTYYVDSASGSDSNSGTSVGSPFKTLTKAASVMVGGDFIYCRANSNQIYRPAGGKLTLGAGNAALTFVEVVGVTGPPTQVRLRSGGSTTVTVYNTGTGLGGVIDITFAAGATANDVKTAFDANSNATALASCTVGGTGASTVSAVAWTSGNSYGALLDQFAGSPSIQGVHSHDFYTSGTAGGSPPTNSDPITIETYPPDLPNKADIRPRGGMSNYTPKNETGSDGVSAATLLGTNVPGGTGSITLVVASHWPNTGSFTLAGITGTIHYTSRSGNTLNGLHDGGTAISGTVSASATASFLGSTFGDRQCMQWRNTVSYYRVRNVILQESGGNRGDGVFVNGGSYIEFYGCEFKLHWYNPTFFGAACDHVYMINCSSHDNGTGVSTFGVSTTSTNPTAQQHGCYFEGNNHMILNCVFYDNPWGFDMQWNTSGTGMLISHVTCVRNGYGDGSNFPNSSGHYIQVPNNPATIKNCVFYESRAYTLKLGATITANNITEDHNILSRTGTLDANHNYYSDVGGNGQATPYAAFNESGGSVTLLTADPGFKNYATRDLRPAAASSITSQAIDSNYSPTFDIAGNTRSAFTAGAYEFVSDVIPSVPIRPTMGARF